MKVSLMRKLWRRVDTPIYKTLNKGERKMENFINFIKSNKSVSIFVGIVIVLSLASWGGLIG